MNDSTPLNPVVVTPQMFRQLRENKLTAFPVFSLPNVTNDDGADFAAFPDGATFIVSGQLVQKSGTSLIPAVRAYSELEPIEGTVVLDTANGSRQSALMTDDVVIDEPEGGVDGAELNLWLTADGGNRTVDFDATIERSSLSALVFPYTIDEGTRVRVRLEYVGTKWYLVSFVPGFAV